MLAEPADAPFSAKGWLFELKYDGYRLLAQKDGRAGPAPLPARRRRDGALPRGGAGAGAAPGRALRCSTASWWCSTARGAPTSRRSRRAAQQRRASDVDRRRARAGRRPSSPSTSSPLGGLDLRPLPLAERKAILGAVAPRLGPVRFADHVEAEGEALFREVEANAARGGGREEGGRAVPGRPLRGSGGRCGPTGPSTSPWSASPRPAARAAPASARSTWRRAGSDGLVYAGSVGSRLRRGDAGRAPRAARGPRPPRPRPAAARCRAAAGIAGWSRSWWWRSGSGSGRARGSSASRSSSGCATTSGPRRSTRCPGPRRRAARPGARGRARGRPRGGGLEPGQGLLPARRDHQGRGGRVLPRHRPLDAAVPRGPARRADPLPRRDRRQELLPEGRADVASGLAAHGDGPLRRRRPGPRAGAPRRRRGDRLDRQPRRHPHPRAGEPRGRASTARTGWSSISIRRRPPSPT